MVEHPAHNGSVTGSTPVGSTEKKKGEMYEQF